MKKQNVRKCGDCVHLYACSMWNGGDLYNTDARSCANYEEVKMTVAYYLGFKDGTEDYNRKLKGVLNGEAEKDVGKDL